MLINDLLNRFRYAADGTGGAPGADAGGAPAAEGGPAGQPESGTEAAEIEPVEIDPALIGEQGQEPEWEDLDFEDFKIRAPKGLAQRVQEGTLRMSDYTKKTQEVAELKKTYEAQTKAIAERGEIDNKISRGNYELEKVDNWLQNEYKYFQSPEYRQLQQSDFFTANERWQRYQLNLQARGDLVGAIQGLMNERNSKVAEAQKAQEAEASKRREQLPREIAKLVPGWNADMAGKVKDFGVSLGYAPEALDSSTDPLHYKTLHLAMVGQAYLAELARAGKGGIKAAPTQATRTVAQRGSGAVQQSDRMSTSEWIEAERKREAAKRKARS